MAPEIRLKTLKGAKGHGFSIEDFRDPEGERQALLASKKQNHLDRVADICEQIHHAASDPASEHGFELAKRLGSLRIYGDNVRAALMAGLAHPDARFAFESARALVAIGYRADMDDAHVVLFRHLASSRNEDLLHDILSCIKTMCVEDAADLLVHVARSGKIKPGCGPLLMKSDFAFAYLPAPRGASYADSKISKHEIGFGRNSWVIGRLAAGTPSARSSRRRSRLVG